MNDDRIVAFCLGWFVGCIVVDLFHRLRRHLKMAAAARFFDQNGEG